MAAGNGRTDSYPQGSGQSHGSMMPYPPAPGSPTLTNPDMILPEDEHPSSPERSQSPLFMWKGPVTINDMQYHMPLQSSFNSGAPITPTTPIIYGNGTMLSDIGEVTEVESNVGGRAPSRLSSPAPAFYNTMNDAALGSSPTMGALGGSTAAGKKTIIKIRSKTATRQRSDSIDSSSTITSRGRPAPFADFDDNVSVDDSVFQGDDEESMAESYADDASVQSARLRPRGSGSALDEENRYSTSSIGRRAELILANAKKRLTTMEGNLSKARTTLYVNPALSSNGSTSVPSPPMPTPDGASSDPNTSSTKFGHSRVPSDNLIQTDTNSSPLAAFPQRSASALGAAGGYRQPLSSSKSVDALKRNHDRGSYRTCRTSLPGRENGLEALSEDEMSHEHQARGSGQLVDFLSPTFGYNPDAPGSRPGSATQMRELKEQVHGLKGRISSLREQAKADSLKRRSLQNLHTGTPFTNAEIDQWSPDSQPETPPSGEHDKLEAGVEHIPQDESHPSPIQDDDETSISEYELASEGLRPPPVIIAADEIAQNEAQAHEPADNDDDDDDMATEDGNDSFNDEFESGIEYDDGASESGESLYHDAYQTPVSHEDREDAFDYEHFFLHSAMGTLSQEHLGRRGSYSSEDSVETTRGPVITPGKERNRYHSRNASTDTSSTEDTFATAREEEEKRRSQASISVYEVPSEEVTKREPDAESDPTPYASFTSPSYDEYVKGIRARRRHNSVIYRPTSVRATSLHRPSVSSFESTGTNRSFPLVNSKTRMNGGVLTPQGSPDEELRHVADALMSGAAAACGKDGAERGGTTVIQALNRDDQILVQRLVAGLGRCVLGLSEAGQASSEGRMYRRRLYEAKKLLEGLGPTGV